MIGHADSHVRRASEEADVDFALRLDGTIALLWARSPEAETWAEEHLPEDRISWAGATVIEIRYVGPIIEGLVADGFTFGEQR